MRSSLLGIVLAIASSTSMAISHSYLTGGSAAGQPFDTRANPTSGGDLSGVAWLVGAGGRCSGALIAPSVVLTAAHCGGSMGSAVFPTYSSSGAYSSSVVRRVTSFVPHPAFNATAITNDIGIAFLESPAPASVKTYSLASFQSFSDINGLGATFAGYGIVLGGLDSTWTSSVRTQSVFVPSQGTSYFVPQLRAGVNRVDRVANNGTVFLTDFDGAGLDAFNTPGFGQYEVGTTQGDSGSGVFYSPSASLDLFCLTKPPGTPPCAGSGVSIKPLSTEPYLFGITSFSSFSNCGPTDYACFNRFGTRDGYTFIAPYVPWIESVLGRQVNVATFAAADLYLDTTGTAVTEFDASEYRVLDPLPAQPVPEPASVALFGLGLAALGLLRRSRVPIGRVRAQA